MNNPPNIVLIMADQLAPQYTSTYGHPVVKTPNLDALAARGARFDAAYCNSPLCSPSRASFMSGKLITNIDIWDNATEFPASIPTFAHYLRSMGYKTCLAGRMHFVGPDQLHGFEERLTTDVYPGDFAWVPDWENNDERIDRWYHNMDSVTEAGPAAAAFQLDYDDEVIFTAKRRIFDFARYKEQPFCLVASFMNPHDPYVARPEFWELYDSAEIDPPKHTIPYNEQDPLSKRLLDGIEGDKIIPTEEQIRNARHGYYANTSYIDDMIGQIVKTLKDAELLDNTIILFTSDHGDMLGERNLWYKMSFFEHSARVPLVMAGPGIVPNEIPNACSLIDVLPTMLDIAGQAGAEQPTLGLPLDGRSLLPLAMGQTDDTDLAISEYCAEMAGDPIFMIRRGQYKYVSCQSDPPMLFDLENDPEERVNLAGGAAYAEIEGAFSAEIAQRYNSPEIRKRVIASQYQRRAVHTAMEMGKRVSWDYNPPRDASNEYVRNHMDWTEAAAITRFPPLKS